MLETLTREQEELCDVVYREYVDDLTKPKLPNEAAIRAWLDLIYGFYDRPCPDQIEIVASPFAALERARELTGTAQTGSDYAGIGESGWVSFYELFHRIGILTDEEIADTLKLRDFIRCAWDTVLLDRCAIVIRRPIVLKVDDAGNFHCTDGPCIVWEDGIKDFAWHGTWVPERMVMDPRGYTKDQYLAITNTEERRALSELGGWQWVAEILGASTVNTWVDPETSLTYELLRCGDGTTLLAKQSPPLKDGSQPKYIEPVHPELVTARAARKWQAVQMTPAQCEQDPDLRYGVEA